MQFLIWLIHKSKADFYMEFIILFILFQTEGIWEKELGTVFGTLNDGCRETNLVHLREIADFGVGSRRDLGRVWEEWVTHYAQLRNDWEGEG